MLNIHPITPELTLTNNYRLQLNWSETDRALSIEVWSPGTGRDGHGYIYTAGVLLAGDELATFVEAIASLSSVPSAA